MPEVTLIETLYHEAYMRMMYDVFEAAMHAQHPMKITGAF